MCIDENKKCSVKLATINAYTRILLTCLNLFFWFSRSFAIKNKSNGSISSFSGRNIRFSYGLHAVFFVRVNCSVDVSMFSLPAIICFCFLPSPFFVSYFEKIRLFVCGL